MKRLPAIIALAALMLMETAGMRAQQNTRKFVPVTDAMLQNPDPANWMMWRRTLDSWGYSPLTQINRNNVAQLRVVWTRGLGPGTSQEATPLVYDGVMYIPNPGDYIQALDAKTGDLIWEYQRKLANPAAARQRETSRSTATNIIDTSVRQLLYRARCADGKARVGNTDPRSHKARQCQLRTDHRQRQGHFRPAVPARRRLRWLRHHGARRENGQRTLALRTRYREPGEPGDETWGGVPMDQRWHVGTWMVPSYDPELNLIYVGTSVTIPAPKFILGGNDNKHLYHNSTLALNADTGKIVWYYQHIVDHWDLDHPFERLLVDTAVAPNPRDVLWINPKVKPGERRKVITGIPGKTGIVYTLDRKTGEFLWARPTVYQNVVSNIDGATGEVTVNGEVTVHADQ